MSGIFTKDIAVLDVTSRLISAIVGTKKAQSVFGIKAVIEKEHQGYENGEWFDKDDTVNIATNVLREAMQTASSSTKRLFIGVPAEFLSVVTKEVSVKLDRQRRIVDNDICYLLKKGDKFDTNKYLTINTSSIYYAIDDNDKLYMDVRGLYASRINACVSYVLCEKRFVEMFEAIAFSLGFKDTRYIASCWSESMALLEKEQRDNIYMLVDVGYISSSISVAKGEGLLDMKSFSLGGGHIEGDIYELLEVPFELAQKAKQLVDLNLNYSDNAILVSDAQHEVFAVDACEVVRARLDIITDIMSEVLKEIEDYAPSYMPIYLTGEGIASIRGAKKYLSEQLGKNIEIIAPKLPGFYKPEDSTKASLLIMADTFAKSNFGDFIKRLFYGGTK